MANEKLRGKSSRNTTVGVMGIFACRSHSHAPKDHAKPGFSAIIAPKFNSFTEVTHAENE